MKASQKPALAALALGIAYAFLFHHPEIGINIFLFAAINWSCVVTRYNLAVQTADQVDWNYLLYELPADNAFLLRDYPQSRKLVAHKQLINQASITDWRSWNYADWRALRDRVDEGQSYSRTLELRSRAVATQPLIDSPTHSTHRIPK